MNKWIVISFFALLACQLGGALDCYTCPFGLCSVPSKSTCDLLQVCKTETASLGALYLKKKTCSSLTQCTGESEETYMNSVKVKTKAECCITDLCNSAATTSASFATVIAVLVTSWATRLF
ncbi:lymphocyte antigen 6B-like [Lithobates pipiens]